MKFIPLEPRQSWKCQIPLNNTAGKKFEIEAKKHQEISRENLAKWRKKYRKTRSDKNREEDEMTNN